jgi:hypothetical protein
MRTLIQRLWEEPALASAALALVAATPDVPGPSWPWALGAAVCALDARRRTTLITAGDRPAN